MGTRVWFLKLNNYLQAYGFVKTKSDTSLSVLTDALNITLLIIYVDDIIITVNSLLRVQTCQ